MTMSEKQPEALRLADALRGCAVTSNEWFQILDDASEELRRLHAENAELRKDAERLDWISENPIHDIGISHDLRWFIFNGVVFKDFREAIDSARSRS